MSTSLFGRTMKTNIILYKSNGKGRDGYITHNNGGFWKDNIKPLYKKDVYPRSPFAVYHSWGKIPPIWTYHSDGSGRDSYVCINNGGLIKKFNSMAERLQNFLRDSNDVYKDENVKHAKYKLSNDEKLYFRRINKIQKDLVNRLYNTIDNKKRVLRKKIICRDNYRIVNGNISYDNELNENNNSMSIDKKEKCNNLIKSASQIYTKKTLEPIKCYKNRGMFNYSSLLKNKNNLMLNNRHISSNSTYNIFRKDMKINNELDNNKNYDYRRKFIFDASDNKYMKKPKIKCFIDSNE